MPAPKRSFNPFTPALLSVNTELWTLRIKIGFARFSILSDKRATVPGFPDSICQLTSVMMSTLPAGMLNDVRFSSVGAKYVGVGIGSNCSLLTGMGNT